MYVPIGRQRWGTPDNTQSCYSSQGPSAHQRPVSTSPEEHRGTTAAENPSYRLQRSEHFVWAFPRAVPAEPSALVSRCETLLGEAGEQLPRTRGGSLPWECAAHCGMQGKKV